MNKPNELVQCACGCGEYLWKYSDRGRERTFLPSHWSRTQPNKRTIVTCEQCGKTTERPQWHMKRVKHFFCNAQCEGKWTHENGRRSGSNNGHYNTITVECSGCGKPVSKPESLIKRRTGRVYCPNCVHLVRRGRKGFYVGYPKEFNSKLRTRIRKRDNYTCQLCGKTQNEVGKTLHVHHIDYDKQRCEPENLISLCNSCHGLTNFAPAEWQMKFALIIAHRESSSGKP